MYNADWDDIKSCNECHGQYDCADMHDVDGQELCEPCMTDKKVSTSK